jgi:hypothetical protein
VAQAQASASAKTGTGKPARVRGSTALVHMFTPPHTHACCHVIDEQRDTCTCHGDVRACQRGAEGRPVALSSCARLRQPPHIQHGCHCGDTLDTLAVLWRQAILVRVEWRTARSQHSSPFLWPTACSSWSGRLSNELFYVLWSGERRQLHCAAEAGSGSACHASYGESKQAH